MTKNYCKHCETEFDSEDCDENGLPYCCEYSDLERATNIIRETYNMLCNITTEEFSMGGDKPMRIKIEQFLGIEDQ